jgi:hypothetical protein
LLVLYFSGWRDHNLDQLLDEECRQSNLLEIGLLHGECGGAVFAWKRTSSQIALLPFSTGRRSAGTVPGFHRSMASKSTMVKVEM